MKMDIIRSEPSPPLSENVSSWSWAQWELEGIGLPGLGSGSHQEMYCLMEDKEIAARAVAFVVNSTRKGIVPLCADVANLLRSKRSLERKVYLLKRENDVFRSSASASLRTSQSTSPTPPSLSSYTEHCMKALQDHNASSQERPRPCSSCSLCSSTLSYSPKVDKTRGGSFRLSCLHSAPKSGLEGQGHCQGHKQEILTTNSQHPSLFAFHDDVKIHENNISVEADGLLCDKVKDIDSDDGNYERGTDDGNYERGTDDGNYERGTDDGNYERGTNTDLHFQQPENSSVLDMDETQIRQQSPECIVANGNSLTITAEIHPTLNTGTTTLLYVPCMEASVEPVTHTFKEEDTFSESFMELQTPPCSQQKNHSSSRRKSLPEMVSTPNKDAQRVCPKISKEVQCSLSYYGSQALEEQFVKTVRLNSQLVEDLDAAREEIEILKEKLREMENKDRKREPQDQLFYEDEKGLEDNGYFTSSNKTTHSTRLTYNSHNKRSSPKRSAVMPISYVGPLPNCKCSACQQTMASDDDFSHYSDQLGDEPPRYALSSKLQVQLGDHVVAKGDMTGYIRYIGHIDRLGQLTTLYVGLELDSPTGKHDGLYQGKRYFYCPKDCGIVLPLQEVLAKVSKKVIKASKSGDTQASSGSRSKKYHKKHSPLLDTEEKSTSSRPL